MNKTVDSHDVVALRDLHRILSLVHAGESLEDVLQGAAQGVVDVLGFRVVAINLLTTQGDFEAVTVLGPATETILGTRNTREDFLAELAVADHWGRLLRYVPAGRHPGCSGVCWTSDEPPLDVEDAWDPEDALFAPLYDADGELVGILSVDLPGDGRKPDATTLTILEMYAGQIGVAVTRAREQDRLRERVRLASATHRIIQTAGAALDLDQILGASIAPLIEGFRTERAWIRLFADEAGGWDSVNFPPDLTDSLAHSPVEPGTNAVDVKAILTGATQAALACWQAQRTLVVAERGYDNSRGLATSAARQRVLDWLAAIGHAQFVLIPLGAGQQLMGYVVLSRAAATGDWTPAEDDASLDMGRELGRVIWAARVQQREQDLVRALKELDAHKSQVFTTVVHELKNPLAAIMGNLELAQEDPTLADRAHQAIATSSQRMLALVQNMLTLTRLRESPTPAHPVEVDLAEVAATVAGLVGAQAAQAGISLDLTDVQHGVSAMGEAEELEQMLLNLVSNAVKYSAEGDTVRLVLDELPDQVILSCVDTGLGISAADQTKLFQEFERSSNVEARVRPGTGLGLAIARRVAERHGGRIEVDSRLGQGSTFSVCLPRTPR